MKIRELCPQHVEHLPDQMKDGILYICIPFDLAAHACCCGCGEEVITPLNKAKWALRERHGRVSLSPSIGNWKFACQSHYWITNNVVYPARRMSHAMIRRVIEDDRADALAFAQERNASKPPLRGKRTDLIARTWRSFIRRLGKG